MGKSRDKRRRKLRKIAKREESNKEKVSRPLCERPVPADWGIVGNLDMEEEDFSDYD